MNIRLNILYVEDNPGDVELLKMSIERYYGSQDIALTVVETVEEVKEIFLVNSYDVVLTDWHLPDGEGIDVVRFIRNVQENMPIFLLSGELTDHHITTAKEYDHIVCLEKDYSKLFIEKVFAQLE